MRFDHAVKRFNPVENRFGCGALQVRDAAHIGAQNQPSPGVFEVADFSRFET